MSETVPITMASLQRMANAKARFVGIPRPGQYAFTVERGILAQLIEGLDDSNCLAELNGSLEIMAETRHYKLNDRWAAMPNWDRVRFNSHLKKTAQRKQANKDVAKVPDWLAREYKLAEKELARNWKPKIPKDSFNWLHLEPSNYDRRTTNFGGGEWPSGRESAAAWYRQKAERKALTSIVSRMLKGLDNFKPAYKALRQSGYAVKTYSQLPTRHGHKILEPEEYAKGLIHYLSAPEFLSSKPLYLEPLRDHESDPDDTRNYVKRVKEHNEAKARLEYVKAQIATYRKDGEIEIQVN